MVVLGTIQANSIGEVIKIAFTDSLTGLAADLTGVSTIHYIFVAPDGTRTVRNGVVNGTAAAGNVKYTTVSGDINQIGYWEAQGVLGYAGGNTLYSSPAKLRITGNL